MNKTQKRHAVLVSIAVILLFANVVVRISEDEIGSGFWNNDTELSPYNAQIQKRINDLNRLPELNFKANQTAPHSKQQTERNPFLFGVDRKKEAEQARRFRELEEQRAQMTQKREAEQTEEVDPARPEFEGHLLGIMESTTGARLLAVSFAQEIFILREGETLANRYKLLEINYETIRFQQLESNELLELKLY